ncbi:putative lipoprotein [Synechococcus sp. WH 8103]|nr:putative lipoprotein [Synechococcus sp. WH 8103]
MTFTEVVVASVVLSLSACLGLQSWTATAQSADRTATQTALAVQQDQQVLASQRLLAAASGSAGTGQPTASRRCLWISSSAERIILSSRFDCDRAAAGCRT